MATTTITVESFQTACAECADAIAASAWGTAWTKYAVASAIHAGLDRKIGDRGASIERREDLAGLREAIDSAQAMVSRSSDNRRMISTQTAHSEAQ